MHPHEKFAIQRFEESLTRPRGGGGVVKKPFFRFTTVSEGGTDKSGKSGCKFSFWNLCADCHR